MGKTKINKYIIYKALGIIIIFSLFTIFITQVVFPYNIYNTDDATEQDDEEKSQTLFLLIMLIIFSCIFFIVYYIENKNK